MPLLFRATGDGRLRPFRASARNRPGIYAGLQAGEKRLTSLATVDVRPVYGPPLSRQSVGRSPVNGADNVNQSMSTTDIGGFGLPGINAGPNTG